ncbi:MAG: 50S ribosomal protein L29 [Planctomycetes bacterium]|nr:50S ribosomal protein L29 [Planctomycetota bacterium]
MASKQMKEMTQKDDKELLLDLQAAKKELFDLRFRSTTEKLSSPAKFAQLRRDIARIKTVMRQRELANAGAGDKK